MQRSNLTPKQEAFALKYVETSCASTAYRHAYDARNMQSNSIHVNACKMLKSAKVSLRVAELMKRNQEKHDITIERLTEMLIEDRQQAKELEQTSTAVSAVMGIAKLHGLVIDRSQATVINVDFVDVLRARLAKARPKVLAAE